MLHHGSNDPSCSGSAPVENTNRVELCEQNASIARTSGILERNHGLHSKKERKDARGKQRFVQCASCAPVLEPRQKNPKEQLRKKEPLEGGFWSQSREGSLASHHPTRVSEKYRDTPTKTSSNLPSLLQVLHPSQARNPLAKPLGTHAAPGHSKVESAVGVHSELDRAGLQGLVSGSGLRVYGLFRMCRRAWRA